MSRIAMLVVSILAIASCSSGSALGEGEVRGVVLEVDGDLQSVFSFVLRTDGGNVITVVPSDDGDYSFPLPHLNDHRSTLSPIIVELDRSVDPPLAMAIRDADSAEWHEGFAG